MKLLIEESLIQLRVKADNCESAIRIAAQPLVDHGKIEGRYVDIPIIKVTPILDMDEKFHLVHEVHALLSGSFTKYANINNVSALVEQHFGTGPNNEAFMKDLVDLLSYKETERPVVACHNLRLRDIVSTDCIQLNVEASTWQEALEVSGKPLIKSGAILQSYIDAIVNSKKLSVSYLVVAPQIALPHSLPSHGALKCAIGITSLKNPVSFGNEDNGPVKYIFFLSALDNKAHMVAMTELLDLFHDCFFLNLLDTCEDPSLIYQYILDNT